MNHCRETRVLISYSEEGEPPKVHLTFVGEEPELERLFKAIPWGGAKLTGQMIVHHGDMDTRFDPPVRGPKAPPEIGLTMVPASVAEPVNLGRENEPCLLRERDPALRRWCTYCSGVHTCEGSYMAKKVPRWQTIFLDCPLCGGDLELTIKPRAVEAVEKPNDTCETCVSWSDDESLSVPERCSHLFSYYRGWYWHSCKYWEGKG